MSTFTKFFLASTLALLAGVSGFAQTLSVPVTDQSAKIAELADKKAAAVAELTAKFDLFAGLNKASEQLDDQKGLIDESSKLIAVNLAIPADKRDSAAVAFNMTRYKKAAATVGEIQKKVSPAEIEGFKSLTKGSLLLGKLSAESYDYATSFSHNLQLALLYEPTQEQEQVYRRGQLFLAGLPDPTEKTSFHLLGRKKN